ncbi:MAG: DNA-directed RNA polymerase subunit F [Candidatus ainarchaeum sp.]|nr:DNA-directed RNA polymerase subunit F [Candidatus ainarchaeum sp.]
MIGEKILGQKAVSLNEVSALLEARKGEKELSYEQDIAFKHAKKFSKLSEEKEKKLREELDTLGVLTQEELVKLVDILPDKKELVQAAVPRLEKDADRILEILLKFAKKK